MLRKIVVSVLLVTGVLLMLSPFIQDQLVVYLSNQHLDAIVPEEFEQNLEAEAEFDFSVIEPIDLTEVLAAWNVDLPVIGEMMIPSVDLHLPVIRGVSNASLSVGAATMKPDQMMGEGNYALASHRMNNPNLLFTPLERVELDDRVYLRDANYVYIYKVTHMEIIEPERVDVIEDREGEGLLTLITCTEDGTQRLMVRGELVEIMGIHEAEEIEELPFTSTDVNPDTVQESQLRIIFLVGGALLIGVGVFTIGMKRITK